MSRAIKFRAWYKDGYIKQISLKNEENMYFSPYDLFQIKPEIRRDVVLEQYTGLKDKNGKEIYEGDRIKIEGSNTIYTVEYGRGVWVASFGDESGDNICLYHYVQKDIVLYAEVIGNIHENPELLEDENE